MQKTSTYNKIKDILVAASKKKLNITELASELYDNAPSFVYYKRDDNGEVKEEPCRESSIRKKIRTCIKLRLLISEDNCSLSDNGENAIVRDNFDAQLRTSVLTYLEENKVQFKDIEDAIYYSVLPDSEALYNYINPEFSEEMFKLCLFLLSEIGKDDNTNIIDSYQKRLYMTEEKKKQDLKVLEKM